MVLDALQGGALRRAPLGEESGSQAIEFALATPMIVLALTLVIGAGLLGADYVAAQGLARDVARTAAVAGPEAARATATQSAGSRPVEVEVEATGAEDGGPGKVRATVRLRNPVLSALGVDAWASGRASMPVEPQ